MEYFVLDFNVCILLTFCSGFPSIVLVASNGDELNPCITSNFIFSLFSTFLILTLTFSIVSYRTHLQLVIFQQLWAKFKI